MSKSVPSEALKNYTSAKLTKQNKKIAKPNRQ